MCQVNGPSCSVKCNKCGESFRDYEDSCPWCKRKESTPPKPLEPDSAEPSIESVMGILEIACHKCSYPDVFGECEEDHGSTPLVPAPIVTAEPQEATGTYCEVFIPTEPQNIQEWLSEAMELLDFWSNGYKPDTHTAAFVAKYKALDVPEKYRLSEIPVEQVAITQEDESQKMDWALSIANYMASRFYPEVPTWEPLPDLLGVLTQISNMTTGLMRKVEPKPSPLGEVSELERKCLYQVAEITAQLSQVQAPLLQKIAELEEKFTRYENQLSKAGSDAFIAQAKADDLEVKLEKAEGRIGLLRVEKADAEARIAELESAQPKAEKVEELVEDAVLADIVKNASSSQYLYYQLAKEIQQYRQREERRGE